MMRRVRSSFTYANVVATLALFLGLAGGAYAVNGVPDPAGVIHACANKRSGALRAISAASRCHPAKRRHGRVVNPGEFAVAWNAKGRQGARGARGARGPQGVQGVPGRNGATNAIVRSVTVAAFGTGSQSVQCNTGERAVGGGAVASGAPSTSRVYASAPTTAPGTPAGNGSIPNGWLSGISNSAPTDTTFYVVCASP